MRQGGLPQRIALAAIAVLAVAAAGALTLTGHTLAPQTVNSIAENAAQGLLLATVGYVIATRRPGLAIGWLMIGVALLLVVSASARQYVGLSTTLLQGLPYRSVALWLGSMLSPLGIWLELIVLSSFFPYGPAGSSRRRLTLAVQIAAVAIAFPLRAVAPGAVDSRTPEVLNPFAIEISGVSADVMRGAGGVAYLVILTTSVGLLVSRYRGGSLVVRQQIKWLAVALAFVFAAFMVAYPLARVLTRIAVYDTGESWPVLIYRTALVTLPPLAIGVAVLRYRLYDIDILIRRTLVYGALSAALVATYAAAVVLFQAALRPLTAGSELAVAASTLAVVALVQPLRRRIRAGVDRRFYRSRYDAARTLEAFSVRMRDQIDVDSVSREVLEVVGATIQPTHASMWLRKSPVNVRTSPAIGARSAT